MDRQTDKQKGRQTDMDRSKIWAEGQTDRLTEDREMNGRTDGRMDREINEQMGR